MVVFDWIEECISNFIFGRFVFVKNCANWIHLSKTMEKVTSSCYNLGNFIFL